MLESLVFTILSIYNIDLSNIFTILQSIVSTYNDFNKVVPNRKIIQAIVTEIYYKRLSVLNSTSRFYTNL